MKISKAEKLGRPLDVIFYSDNCCGQQKNYAMFAMYSEAVKTMPHINSITHKYLVRGHTQNEGDSVHSVIEAQIKRARKSGPIFHPAQYNTLIMCGEKTGKPYKVVELNHKDFLDFKALPNIFPPNLKISNLRIIQMKKEDELIHFKESFGEDFQTAQKTTAKARKSQQKKQLLNAYKSKLPIAEKKER